MTNLVKFINKKIESQRTDLDFECMELIETNINLAIPWYLMASYAYYEQDDPILSDAMFDNVAKRISKNWETIEHRHKDLLDIDQVNAATYNGSYPELVKDGLKRVRKIYQTNRRRS